jgi:hypothetical protein
MAQHGFRQQIGGEEMGELQACLRIVRSQFIVFFRLTPAMEAPWREIG